MARKPTPNWQPITQLALIGSFIDEALQGVTENDENLRRAQDKPHVLDDHTLNRVIQVYSEQRDDLWFYEDQLARWQKETLSTGQRQEVTRLVTQVAKLKELLPSVLALAESLKAGSIDTILAKSDMELALEVLLGQRPPPEAKPTSPPASLPNLTVNASFFREFLAADAPCCALGMVEVDGAECGLIALRPGKVIPAHITGQGFRFGHGILGNDTFEVVHFAFQFYGFETYNVLLNPANPVVQAVLNRMVTTGDYFFFALDSDQSATAFRSQIEENNLWGLKALMSRLNQSQTTEAQYQRTWTAFEKNPEPEGMLLTPVCHDNIAYLDLSADRFELTPN